MQTTLIRHPRGVVRQCSRVVQSQNQFSTAPAVVASRNIGTLIKDNDEFSAENISFGYFKL